MHIIKERIHTTIQNLQKLFSDDDIINHISESTQLIISAIKSGNKLMICGNGGSAADAQHMAGEFVCRFYKDREPLPAIALTTDTSILTAVSNDYSYDHVFSRQVKVIGRKGDVLLGISTSGSSKNVLEAFKTARQMEIKTILLTGQTEKEIAQFSDIVIKTPSTDTPRIQEMHILIEHIICELVEEAFIKQKIF
ncbi:MAG TPA: D-sedoheptulose 7-phosphate isomerase [Syntrophorhabdaceae bacterium]|mgnify:FL=1|nr:D-sedoheptulose 7-phosphate isomerase [Syntrophorhabdaceae bacterium]